MIDTTDIGYAIFYAYGFIIEDRFADWRKRKSDENPNMTNEEYTIGETEEKIANGRREAEQIGIVELYDEWIRTDKAYFEHCRVASPLDEEGKRLQRERIELSQKVERASLGLPIKENENE